MQHKHRSEEAREARRRRLARKFNPLPSQAFLAAERAFIASSGDSPTKADIRALRSATRPSST